MNEFSLLCRILGSCYYRTPDDAVLAPIFDLLKQGKLPAQWPLEQDALLQQWQQAYDLDAMKADYQQLFQGEQASVSLYSADWDENIDESAVRQFLTERGMPLPAMRTDHFGFLLLAASWLEDHSAADETAAQQQLFEDYLLPWCGTFLGKVEAHAQSAFYRTLAAITRGALQAMVDELTESTEQPE